MLSESDISVTIGSEDCHVTSMSATQLTCKPLFDDVEDIGHVTLDSKPVVIVRVSLDVLTSHKIIIITHL